MITEQEARDAAARISKEAAKDNLDDLFSGVNDCVLIHRWALQELACRDAERNERAKPIDVEWLLSIGFDDIGGWVGKFVGGADLWYRKLRGDVGINMHFLPSITTRGQLLDLLAALKGGEP